MAVYHISTLQCATDVDTSWSLQEMLDVVVTAPLNRSRVGSRLAARPSRFHGAATSVARASASQMESEKVTGGRRPFGTERERRVPSLPSFRRGERASEAFCDSLGTRGRRKREPRCGGEQARSLAPDPLAGLTSEESTMYETNRGRGRGALSEVSSRHGCRARQAIKPHSPSCVQSIRN